MGIIVGAQRYAYAVLRRPYSRQVQEQERSMQVFILISEKS